MQTPQVSNPANLVNSQPTATRQADAGSSDAQFGQVLSREIAGRNTSDAGKAHSREAGHATSARQPTKTDGRQARAQDIKDTNASGAAKDTTLQASEDMLALVANIVQMTQPAEKVDSQAGTPAIAEDPNAALIASSNSEMTDNPVAALTADPMVAPMAVPLPAGLSAQPQVTDPTLAGTQAASAATLAAASAAIPAAATTAPALGMPAPTELGTLTTPDSPQPNLTDLAAKGREFLNGATPSDSGSRMPERQQTPQLSSATPMPAIVGTSSAPDTPDFAAAVKDSASALTGVAGTMMAPVQQAVLHAAQSLGNNAERLTPRVGTPAWDQALGQKVVWMVAGEQQSASLTLNPPDLGPLQVVLNVSNSQASATFTAAQPEVRQALEAALPKLREMLSEAGIQLGQASVNSGSPNQQGAFEQQAGAASQGLGHDDHRNAAAEAESPRVSRVRPATVGQGMVDTFA